ncbi:MAG: hypothetical protein MUC50_17835 [Myxococcota bacterium]|jgi:hypothetical protein|nr:hypothetical protein [Myxococcota bacterium]
MLKQPLASDRWPRGISYDGGFRILGTPLGFGKARDAGLMFLPHADAPIPRRGSRVLTTPVCAAAIDASRRGLDALTLGYDRRIRLGRMDLRLVPAGLGPGSAMLEVSFKDRTILYCGGLRTGRPLSAPAVENQSCDLVLLDIPTAEPKPPSPQRTADRLFTWVASTLAKTQVAIVACGTMAAALEVLWVLREGCLDVRAHRPVFECSRRLSTQGLAMPPLHRLDRSWPGTGVVLYMADAWKRAPLRETVPRGSVAFAGSGRAVPAFASISFRLGEPEDRPGLVSFVLSTGARQVALGPKADPILSDALAKAGIEVFRVSSPTQMALPL